MANVDPALRRLLSLELKRQQQTLSLIASENIASPAVVSIASSVLTNKYSEGFPGHRYYGGNQIVDQIEQLAIDRAKKLFGAEYANVQPHAGAIANLAVFQAFLKPGDKILALDLKSGGHLTMGHKANISGQWFTIIPYGLDKDGLIDMKQVRALAKQHAPKMIISGASAYPRIIDFAAFGRIAKSVGAIHMADISHIAGLVASNLHPSPVPHADVVTMTTHKTLRGPRGAMILARKVHGQRIDKAVMPGVQGGPLDHIIAAKAQALYEALQPSYRNYQRQVLKNAKALASTLQRGGVSLSSGGTENHLLLADITSFGITGAEAERRLEGVGLIVNKNVIPNDPRGPLDPSGIRLGTPAVTTRGLKETEIKVIGQVILGMLRTPSARDIRTYKKTIASLAKKFSIYPGRLW